MSHCAAVSRSLSTDKLLVACRVLGQHVRVHYQQCQAHWGASVCCYLSTAGAAELGEPFCSGNRRCRRSRSDLWTSDAGKRTMATKYHNILPIMPLSTGTTAHRQEAGANVSLISGPLEPSRNRDVRGVSRRAKNTSAGETRVTSLCGGCTKPLHKPAVFTISHPILIYHISPIFLTNYLLHYMF